MATTAWATEPLGSKVRKSPRRRMKSTGIQLTKVGFWYLLGTVVVATAAINTGNNGLFLTVAALAASFVVAHVVSWWNLVHLDVEVTAEREIYANSPSSLDIQLRNTSRWAPSWLVVTSVMSESLDPPERRPRKSLPWLVPFLPGGAEASGSVGLMLERRGLRRLRFLSVSSLFPLGLFRKERRTSEAVEILVYPEIQPVSLGRYIEIGPGGDYSVRRAGLGHELHTLRDYQAGDDPRDVHWKQSARQQTLIVQRRQSEKLQRLRIAFDNGVGELEDESDVKSFERLVSEAASAAVEALGQGYDVGLLTRDVWLDFATGDRQRRNILEVLARIETRPLDPEPLVEDDPKGLLLRLGGPAARGAAEAGAGA
ncbi:MAG: DUF58 domain-containing protein [Acidobacteriota bacterium]